MTRKSSPLKQYNGKMLDVLEAKETPPRHRSNKDTKKWCGGHPGREHIGYWDSLYWTHFPDDPDGGRSISVPQQKICIVCGKHLKYRHWYIRIVKGVYTIYDNYLDHIQSKDSKR